MALLIFISPAYSNEEIQRRFSEAMLSIERDPKTAVEILSGLTNETDAIRIKLELARALYLSGQLHDSRDKFVEVLGSYRSTLHHRSELMLNGF